MHVYASQVEKSRRDNALVARGRVIANSLEPLRCRRTVANLLGITPHGVAYIESRALVKVVRLMLRAGLFVLLATTMLGDGFGAELFVSNQSTGSVRLVISGLPGATLMPAGTSFSGRFTPDGTNVVQVYEATATNFGPVQVGLANWTGAEIGSVRVWIQETGEVASDEAASPLYWFFRGGAFGSAVGLGLWIVRWLKLLASAFEHVTSMS